MGRRLSRSGQLVAMAGLLAVGIGVAASALTLRRALESRGLPYPAADRLVTLIAGSKSWSPSMFDAVMTSTTVLETATLVQERAAIVRDDGPARVLRLETVSPAYFHMLGVSAAAGRLPDDSDDRIGASEPIAVISHALWNSRFAGAPEAIGRRIRIDEREVRIVGVLPRGFSGLIGRTDVWVTVATGRWLDGETAPIRPWSRSYELLARTNGSAAFSALDARYAIEARQALMQLPDATRALGANARFRMVPLADARVAPVMRQAATALGWAATAVLLFVVINVVSLSILRSEQRGRELAIRVAIGASRTQLAQLALRDAAIVAGLAVVGALVIRPLLLTVLSALRPPSTSFGIVTANLAATGAFALDLSTVVGMVLMAGLGALPMLVLMLVRGSQVGVIAVRGAVHAGMGRLWRSTGLALIAVQAALACAVLVGAGLMTRTAVTLFSASRGYDWTDVFTAQFELPDTRYSAAALPGFLDTLTTSLARVPGMDHVSVANCAPGAGRCRQSNIMRVDGRAIAPPEQPHVGVHFATPDHFTTIGASIARGRAFSAVDHPGAPKVVVISEALATRLWPGADPIGRSLEVYTANGSLAGERTIVGTVRPIVFSPDADSAGDVFLPAAQASWTSTVLFLKTRLPVREIARAIAFAITALDPDVPVQDVEPLDAQLGRSLGVELLVLRALIVFGGIGLALAAIGTYATLAQALARSRRELSIRIALGATPAGIWMLVARRGVLVAVVAAAAGIAGAALSTRLLSALLHGLSPYDPIAFLAAPIATMLGIMAAVARPAWRASRVAPVLVLKGD